MKSLPPFLTLWILVEFTGSSDEDILMIKVRKNAKKGRKLEVSLKLLMSYFYESRSDVWRRS